MVGSCIIWGGVEFVVGEKDEVFVEGFFVLGFVEEFCGDE